MKRRAIVCSAADPASLNIKRHLLEMDSWDQVEWKLGKAYENDRFVLVEISELLIYADHIDQMIVESGFDVSGVIFASKHRSKDGRKILTVHFTGNLDTADFGGKKYSLAKPSPGMLRSSFLTLKELTENTEYQVTMEATHHGPTEIYLPSLFIEIGSSIVEWEDEVAGEIVAKTILSIDDQDFPVFVGVGGTHYMPRQSDLLKEASITFGHCFAKYAIDALNQEIFEKALKISEAEFVYMDMKSLNHPAKKKIRQFCENLSFEIMASKDVKSRFGV